MAARYINRTKMDENVSYVGGIQRFSTEDGPGIRTTIFLKGCPLHCQWCHNPELIDGSFVVLQHGSKCIRCGKCVSVCPSGSMTFSDGEIHIDRDKCVRCGACVDNCCSGALFTKAITYTVEEILAKVEKDRSFYESSGGGVTLSGGEILAHGAYALSLAREIKAHGLSLAVETSGFGNYEELLALAELSDWILFDMKHMDPAQHRFYTGASPVPIWDNLSRLTGAPDMARRIIVRVPLISGVNDSEENLTAVAQFMLSHGLHRIHLLPYHNMGLSKARQAGLEQREFETPSDAVLDHRRRLLREYGLQVEVMGHEG